MLKRILVFTFFSALKLQSMQCLPNFWAVEEGRYYLGDVVGQMNGLPDGNQMMVNNVDSGRTLVSTASFIPVQDVPQSQPVMGVPPGLQQSSEDLKYLPPSLHTNRHTPGPHPQVPNYPSQFFRQGYDHQPIQTGRQPAHPRFRPKSNQLNQGHMNEFNLRQPWLAGIDQNVQKFAQNAKQKLIKSKTKNKKQTPLEVKKVIKKASNKNKDRVLTKPDQDDYPHIRLPKDVHEGIQAGFKSTTTEVSNTANNQIVTNLAELNAEILVLERKPRTLQNQIMLDRIKRLIGQKLQERLDIPLGLIPQDLEPTLANALQCKERLMYTQMIHTNEYKKLNTFLNRQKKTPLLVELPTSGATESVGSKASGDDLKTSEEVDSGLTKLTLGPSSNYEAASRRFQRIPTFDLNQVPDT